MKPETIHNVLELHFGYEVPVALLAKVFKKSERVINNMIIREFKNGREARRAEAKLEFELPQEEEVTVTIPEPIKKERSRGRKLVPLGGMQLLESKINTTRQLYR